MRSSEASQKTLLRRSRQLSDIRASISGGDSCAQLQSELRCLTREERQQVLKEANLPIVVPPDHALGIKAETGLPWAKLRVLTRYM